MSSCRFRNTKQKWEADSEVQNVQQKLERSGEINQQ